ncbi:Rz1-like lysis system protein LysC [Nitratidesulfovibrio vulgaris]
MLCGACSANRREVVAVPETVRLTPPATLMQETPTPDPPVWDGATNGDLLDYAQDSRAALGRCNADKAGMRKWAGTE